MNKKVLSVAIISVLIIILVCSVFAMSAGAPKTSLDLLLTVNDKEYTITDFKKYAYIKNEADGNIDKEMTSGEKETMMNDYMQQKVFLASAEKNNITVPSGETQQYKSDYTSKKEVFVKHGITENDYLEYKEDEYKVGQLKNNFGDYYELPANDYADFLKAYSGDELKTYSFRIMNLYYEEPVEESGDVSGDISGEIAPEDTTESGEEKEDRTRETILAKAENVHAELLNSGDFEELAKENGSYRIALKGNGYTFINGDLEYAAYPLFESKVQNEKLYKELLTLSPGEITEIVEDEENNVFYIAKLENVEDGFVGEAETELKQILLSQSLESLVIKENTYDVNMAGLRILYAE